ncbi:TetR/AcrR family transcriptional regulator [Wenzhouxiangella sediminis]|uniref:TetR/AcrR family transcriptional regulator n=1 Tax=Wenzhouxiangella sediminis TaxID=1792836 RepID=A0A3E1K6R8_9GAMM|nr:TetR/AcrR family transcriptional regulator [Wenzhouxiangella sediminis]RFF29663.1 TetR/AcrR family transcriptional regulator [Wenzhouxiangella sediminis]
MSKKTRRTRQVERTPGRPSGDSDIRDRLLEIALREFSTHGFRGVSVTTIAKEAGATPAMIHYYFANKQGLYEAVLQHALGPILSRLEAVRSAPPEGEDLLPRFVRGYMQLLAENPAVPSLIVRDVLSPGGQMRETFLNGFASRGGSGVRDLVKRAQALGRLRDDLDPDLAALSLLSMAVFPFVGRPVAGQVLDYSLAPEHIDVLAEHTLNLFYNGASAS